MLRSSKRPRAEEWGSLRCRRAVSGLLAFAALPLLLAACGGSMTASSTKTAVSIPPGWKTYTYGKMVIAVPSTWAVKHDTNCPNAPASGTLLLGVPPVLIQCVDYQYPATVVTVSRITAGTPSVSSPGQKPVIVNGVPVYVGFGSPSSLEWAVPSLGVEIRGNGPNANKALHTLHRA
jgi:hypothetical protein